MTGSPDHQGATPTRPAVAVLGCGNMGSAMVRALMASGRRVVAWNRTPERAQALAADGAEVRTSAGEALAATPLAILCVSTTAQAKGVLEAATPEELSGVTILNTTSGTPEDGRTMHDWAQDRGVQYLDAAIGAYPEQLGTESARLLVAGDEGLWKAHQEAIFDLAGSSLHVGTDHSAANAVDAAMTGAFYISSLTAFLEAARFTVKFGVSHEVMSELAQYSVSVLDHQIKLVLDRIASGNFSTDQATLNVYADASSAFAAGLNERGNAPMIQTTAHVLRQAVEAGLGDEDIAAAFTLGS